MGLLYLFFTMSMEIGSLRRCTYGEYATGFNQSMMQFMCAICSDLRLVKGFTVIILINGSLVHALLNVQIVTVKRVILQETGLHSLYYSNLKATVMCFGQLRNFSSLSTGRDGAA